MAKNGLEKDRKMDYGIIRSHLNNMIDNFLSYTLTRTTSITRYNTRKFIIKQNVAEHAGNTTMIAMVFSDYFNSIGIKNDTETVMRMAITHDNDEVVSGDLPHPAKYQYGDKSDKLRKAVDELNENIIEYMYNMIPHAKLQKLYKENYHLYKKRKAIESKIVKLADCTDVIIYANNEIALGNKTTILEKRDATERFNRLLKEITTNKDGSGN